MERFIFFVVVVLRHPVASSIFPFLNQTDFIWEEVYGQKMPSYDGIRFHFFPSSKDEIIGYTALFAGFGTKRQVRYARKEI